MKASNEELTMIDMTAVMSMIDDHVPISAQQLWIGCVRRAGCMEVGAGGSCGRGHFLSGLGESGTYHACGKPMCTSVDNDTDKALEKLFLSASSLRTSHLVLPFCFYLFSQTQAGTSHLYLSHSHAHIHTAHTTTTTPIWRALISDQKLVGSCTEVPDVVDQCDHAQKLYSTHMHTRTYVHTRTHTHASAQACLSRSTNPGGR